LGRDGSEADGKLQRRCCTSRPVAEFDRTTLIVTTPFADVDEHLEGIESELGIDQGWCADSEAAGQRVDIVGHKEALAMTL
jgi:hypothetical protein